MTTRTAHRLPRRTATAASALTALAVLLGATACSTGDEPVTTYADLAARPRLEEVVARYEQMQQRIRDALDRELGPLGWFQVREASTSTCIQDVPPDAGGRNRSLAPWGFDAPVPDGDWKRVSEIVSGIAGEYGFTIAGLDLDRADHHVLNGIDPGLGARIRFGSQAATTMSVTTGCHLPAG